MQEKTKHRLEPDNIVDDKLSIVLGNIETLLKPYSNTLGTRIEKVNGVPKEIVIVATIKLT